MNELQLVGYTADLKFLVFSDAADGAARFKVPVDEDLEATLNEVLQLIDPSRGVVRPAAAEGEAPQATQATQAPQADQAGPAPTPAPTPAAAQTGSTAAGAAEATGGTAARSASGLFDEDDDDLAVADDDEELFAPSSPPPAANGRKKKAAVALGQGTLAAQAVLVREPEASPNGRKAPPEPEVRDSRLSPRQIQALLRAGLTTRQVAKRADTDEAWVARWLAPIEAERDLVLKAVERCRVTKARLGESRDLLGDAVRKNLREKGLRLEDEHVEWFAQRRENDPYWVVTLRYRSRGRNQRAVWHYDPETKELEPRNALATDIAWTRPRKTGRGSRSAAAPRPAAKKATAKKATAKKATGKKATGKKATGKKATGKKATAKKATAKKATAKKATGKKATAKKSSRKSAGGR